MSGYREAVLADRPSAYFRLGEPSGNALNEVGGTGAKTPPSGTYAGTVTRGTKSQIAHTADRCITLGGAGNVFVPDDPNIDVGDVFTVELWIANVGAAGTDRMLVSKGPNAFYVMLDAANKIRLAKHSVGTIALSTATYGAGGGWRHVVVTKNGSTVKIYVNAVDVTGAVTNLTCVDNANQLGIGADYAGGNKFTGIMDEVAIYKYALSSGQVRAHYLAGTVADDFPDVVVEMALDSNPLDAVQLWRNYTEFVKSGSTSRGRGEELQTIEAGTASVEFHNTDARFDPFNLAGPYFGTLKPGRALRVSFDWYGVRYPAFTGYIDAWNPDWAPGPYSSITLEAADGLSLLSTSSFGLNPAPTLFGTWKNESPSTFTDGSALAPPNYARDVWAEVTGIWWEDTLVSFLYTNQDGSGTPGAGLPRQATIQIPAGSNPGAGVRFPLPVVPGDVGIRDITAAGSNSIAPGGLAVYGQQETFPPVLSGTRIAAILDSIGWPAGATWRRIAPGWSTIRGFTPAVDEQPLARLREVGAAEIGDFFMDARGRATFHDRHSRWGSTPFTELGPVMALYGDGPGATELPYVALDPEFDYKRVLNDFRITAEGEPAAAPAQVDTASITSYGRKLYAQTFPFADKTEPARMAIQLKTWYPQPDERFNAITIIPRPKYEPKARATLEKTLAREFGDRIQVYRRPPGGTLIDKTCRIEGIAYQFAPKRLSVTFQLSPDRSNPWY